MDRIVVEIYGDENDEHTTYVKINDEAVEFYWDGFNGTKAKDIIELLKF